MAIVTRVIGDCPNCGEPKSFGNVMIPQGQYVLRGCGSCSYKEKHWLPKNKKAVLYLDQNALSGAYRGADHRFVEIFKAVGHSAALQLVVAPYSSVHEDETHQWRGHDGRTNEQLMKFIKMHARGASFKDAFEIESTQIQKGFARFLSDGDVRYNLEVDDAVNGHVDTWDDYFWIDVGRYMGDIELIRRLKQEAVEMLVRVFDEWARSTNSVEQDIALERADAGRQYINSYLRMAWRIGNGDVNALLDAPAVSTIVQRMMHQLPRNMPGEERLARCIEFFASEQFAELPYEYVSSRMFAALKDQVRRGAFANRDAAVARLGGFFYDMKHIATYAPYCDGFFMDQAMADLVAHPTVGLPGRHGTRIFSLNNYQQLLDWLRELELGMSAEHKRGLELVDP